jgi:hypothetical protein
MSYFEPKNSKNTSYLYSKFVVKGIKPQKIDLVKQSFEKRKLNLKQ